MRAAALNRRGPTGQGQIHLEDGHAVNTKERTLTQINDSHTQNDWTKRRGPGTTAPARR